ncbi:MAG: hypothetical protein M3137_00930 [Actinomycetota bacterium]|nr:hypothetical protein [Actinomycetota bacterium]
MARTESAVAYLFAGPGRAQRGGRVKEMQMPGRPQDAESDSHADSLAEQQEKLNESVATGEDQPDTVGSGDPSDDAEGEDPDDESEESFPASDPPANY